MSEPTQAPRYKHPAAVALLPLDRHAVIEASAGTGKTYTIEHLVVDRLLRSGCTLDKILVVTFTEKATQELRLRIRGLVETLLDWRGDDGPEQTWCLDTPTRQQLEAALFAFDRAPIFTIHGFCKRVLDELAFATGALFKQEVIDGRRAFARALREVIRTDLAVDETRRAHLATWLKDHDERELQRLLFDAASLDYQTNTQQAAGQRTLVRALAATLDPKAMTQGYQGTALTKAGVEGAEASVAALTAALDVDDLGTDTQADDALARVVALDLRPLLHPHRCAVSKQRGRFPDTLPFRIKAIYAQIKDLDLRLRATGGFEAQIVEAFLPPVLAHLDAQKRQRGELDYDDMLKRVWQALDGDNGAALATLLRERYHFALVDECQDTDPLQWAIFRRIFVEGPGNLTLIGDPKQAIYSFRGADVHTYLSATKALCEGGGTRLDLDTNYRSTPAMVDAYNAVFDQQSKHPFFEGDIRYDQPVRCGRSDLRLVRLAAPHEVAPPMVLWRLEPPRPRGRGAREIFKSQITAPMRDALARDLFSLLYDPTEQLAIEQTTQGPEGPETTRRPLRPQDIFILVYNRYDAMDVGESLALARVPFAFYRQEGLFQTTQAQDVLDVLKALAAPHDRAARLRALSTSYFDVPYEALSDYRDLDTGHPLIARLLRWQSLAEAERYPALFRAMLEESGLTERLMFGLSSDTQSGERALTNHQHVLEAMLEATARRRLDLGDTVALLDRYVSRQEQPEGVDGNVQRLPSERDAVQVMTIHKSKGLEAPVVVVYGGYSRSPEGPVGVIQSEEGRRVIVGKENLDAVKDLRDAERMLEDQRLLYVALTRASARTYLPFIDTSRQVKGGYQALNRRLYAMHTAGLPPGLVVHPTEVRPRDDRWRPPTDTDEQRAASLQTWIPAPYTPTDLSVAQAALKTAHPPLLITSYTRMKRAKDRGAEMLSLATEEFRAEVETVSVADDAVAALPPGRGTGLCLHEALERVPFESVQDVPFAQWSATEETGIAFEWVMRRYDIEAHHGPALHRVVYDALTRPIPLGDTAPPVKALCECRHVVEMEFLFPIPERQHPLLDDAHADLGFHAERGFIKGFIDLLFEHEGRTYVLDWKSDTLADYAPAALVPHVTTHYALQAELYTLGVLRWLGVRDEADYEARFGGLVYLFLRGIGEAFEPDSGVYFARPTWAEVVAAERSLLETTF